MNEATKNEDYDDLRKVISEAKHLSPERRNELIHAIHSVPKVKRSIDETDVKEWFALHVHPKTYKGAIGGHITKTVCYTSIGELESYFCSTCGEYCWVDTHL